MKYYSTKLKRLYDSPEELKTDEEEYDKRIQEERDKKQKEAEARNAKLSEYTAAKQELRHAYNKVVKLENELFDNDHYDFFDYFVDQLSGRYA